VAAVVVVADRRKAAVHPAGDGSRRNRGFKMLKRNRYAE
jgi:hypothetical protein